MSADVVPRDSPATIHSVNTILMTILKAAKDYKGSRVPALLSGPFVSLTDVQLEYIPWTSSLGTRGIRTLLISQHSITVDVS